MKIDQSVYPDLDEPPVSLTTDCEKADYVQRICAAWDFGIHPDAEVFAMFKDWKTIFDHYPVATSPAYHAFRTWFGWESIAYPPGTIGPVPRWIHLDRLEGRPDDPCREMI